MTRRPPKKSAASVVDVTASRQWNRALPQAARICRRVARAAVDAGRRNAGLSRARSVDLGILLTTDAAVRKLNAAYRNQDKATNVLSFPAFSEQVKSTAPAMLGDVVVAYSVAAREAKGEGKSLAAHLSHLVVHGVLHLLGYDHIKDADALTMERLETKTLARLGISDPYAALPDQRTARDGRS